MLSGHVDRCAKETNRDDTAVSRAGEAESRGMTQAEPRAEANPIVEFAALQCQNGHVQHCNTERWRRQKNG